MDLDRRIRHLDLGQACASDMLAIQHSKGVCYLSLHSEHCAPCIRRSQGNRELPVWRGCAFRGTGCTGRLCWSDGFFCWWMISWIFMLVSASCTRMCRKLHHTAQHHPIFLSWAKDSPMAVQRPGEWLGNLYPEEICKKQPSLLGREFEYIWSL